MKKLFILMLTCTLCSVSLLSAQVNDLYLKKTFVKEQDTLPYRVMYPDNFSKDKKYPLILFLHGAGERGNDNQKQLIHGSSLFASEQVRNDYPAIVVFPQCPKNDYWSSADVDRSTSPLKLNFHYQKEPTTALKMVMKLVDQLSEKSYIENAQIYVIGLSMGAMGTFELLSRNPDLYAAAIPICGGGNPESVNTYAKRLPIWIFHGAKDKVVAPNQSVEMVSAILKNGGHPKFTLFDNAHHNSWDPALATPDLLSWLFSKSLELNNNKNEF